MKYRRGVTALFLLGIIFLFSAAAECAHIDRTGKRIQLDGFLMDWQGNERREWGGSAGWHWDALSTPEGVAGYISSGVVHCPDWTFTVEALHGQCRPLVVTVPDTGGAEAAGPRFACGASSVSGSGAVVSVEWVIPWDSLNIDSAGNYAVRLAGWSACGDTLNQLLLTGAPGNRRGGRTEAPGAAAWMFLAAVLIAAAGTAAAKVRARYCRMRTGGRESPRR